MARLLDEVSRKLLKKAQRLREDIHRHPELGLEESRTSELVAEHLGAIGLDKVQTGLAKTGVVGVLEGGQPGRTVGLRADMDALPIREETGLPYASENEGVMHACGHDGHTAVLMATAELLAGMREEIGGTVKFIFQPAEEGAGGGKLMAEAGCLKGPDVDAVFAFHGLSSLAPGEVLITPTPAVTASMFSITVEGKGGHGAMPHRCVDPVVVAAQIVCAAQTIVSREVPPDEPAVLSFCSLQSGVKDNVIPDSAVLLGTVRSMEEGVSKRIHRSLGRLARAVAKGMRARADYVAGEWFPPVKNDAKLLEMVREVAVATVGRKLVRQPDEQIMGGEDFAYYLSEQGGVPGVLFWVGVGSEGGMHTSTFDFGSEALEPAILMMTNTALRYLAGG